MGILDAARRDTVKATTDALIEMVGDVQGNSDFSRGTVTVETMTFTFSGGSLRMMGFCPVCGQEVLSTPIRRASDIHDQMNNFRAAKHNCMDV